MKAKNKMISFCCCQYFPPLLHFLVQPHTVQLTGRILPNTSNSNSIDFYDYGPKRALNSVENVRSRKIVNIFIGSSFTYLHF